jgi:hypothetical protein
MSLAGYEEDPLTDKTASLPNGGYSITPEKGGRIGVTSGPMNIAMAASLHRDLGELIEGKVEHTEDGWKYL